MPPPRAAQATWFEELQALARELPALLGDRVELLTLELQRAGKALAQIVAFVIAAAIVGVTAWLTLWAGIVTAMIVNGLHWAWALAVVLLVNLLAARLAWGRVRALLPQVALPATRRHLSFSPSTRPAPAVPPTSSSPANVPHE